MQILIGLKAHAFGLLTTDTEFAGHQPAEIDKQISSG